MSRYDINDDWVIACIVLGFFGSAAMIASGAFHDHGLANTGTGFGVVGVALYFAAAAIWFRKA